MKSEEQPGILSMKELIEERKNKAIETLSASYAKDRLPLEEYERLVEYINKVESERELVIVEKIAAEHRVEDLRKPADVYDKDNDEDEDRVSYQSPQIPASLAVLSSRSLSGPIKSGSQYVSILGSQQIKITKADLEKRETVLNVVSILGECVILVESGIRVINKVIPILGESNTNHKVNKQARKEDPELMISGTVLLGSITVKLIKE